MPADPNLLAPPEAPPAAEASNRILDAARVQLFTYGYNALTMDDLAHELGMSKKTLYVHFPGKEAIIDAVIDGIGRGIRREVDAVLGHPRLSFQRKLAGIIELLGRRLSPVSPAVLRELQRYSPRCYRRIEELRRKNIPEVFGRLLRDGIAAGAVRPDLDPDFAAQFWLAAVRGLIHPDTLAVTELSPRQSLEKACHLFAGGLLTAAGRKEYEKISAR